MTTATSESPPSPGPFEGGDLRARHHFAISAYWLATNLLWGAYLIIIVPSQIKLLAPTRYAETEGFLLGWGAIPAMVVPILVGALSDRCRSRFGRRRPYMVLGVVINLIGLAMAFAAGQQLSLWLYFAAYLVVQTGNNAATGAYSGMIPDLVPKRQRGEASGWMAAMTQFGTIIGTFTAGQLMDRGMAGTAYVIVAICLVAFLLVTVLGVRERPCTTQTSTGAGSFLAGGATWILGGVVVLALAGIAEAVVRLALHASVSVFMPVAGLGAAGLVCYQYRKHPNFVWVWFTRALVVMGLWTVQQFMQYYLADRLGVADPEKQASFVLGIGLICATVTGILGGSISDRVGRKPVVYVANTIIALAALAFVGAHSMATVYLLGAVFGLGYGAYYSVDWALGCDVLPNQESEAAKDMGIWHVAMVLPQSIALPVSGILLGAMGKKESLDAAGKLVAHYSAAGYTLMFGMAAFYFLLGALLLRNVKGVR